jgi:3',5'-cyclic AMP phosphodiesterase CpdA
MPKLFVIMPFGLKRHEGVEFDFDSVYRAVIRPTAKRVGWDTLRIDEVPTPGAINDQYLRELLSAELVLADISIPNANVYYELGVRHAVSSSGTLLISSATPEDVPFDLRGQRIIFFDRSQTDTLAQGIAETLKAFTSINTTSPLRPFLERAGVLANPKENRGAFEMDVAARIERAKNSDQLIALWKWLEPLSPLPVVRLRDLAERLSDSGEWLYAAEVLRTATAIQPNDFELYRRLGWFLQQAGADHDESALAAYNKALAINPNDPETLGLMGGREKRKRNFAGAIDFYKRGASLSPNNRYMLVNQAAMLILSNPSTPTPGIELYHALRDRLRHNDPSDEWSEILIGESCFASGDFADAEAAYRRAAQMATSPKPLRSAADQLDIFASVSFQPTQAATLADELRALASAVEAGSPLPTDQPAARGNAENAPPILIHVSDIHFGSKAPGGKSLHRFFVGENSQPLSEHLREEFDQVNGYFKVDAQRLYLIASGDFAYRAVKQEFDEAKSCLESVCQNLAIAKDRVIIVPGNHDANWTISQDDRSHRFDHFLRLLFEFYGPELCRKKYPLIDWPLGYDNEHPEAHQIVSIHRDPVHDILFLGLNSCVYETHQDHFGFVGERQIKEVRKLVARTKISRTTLKVAVIHHHLHPFPELLEQREPAETWHDVSTIRDAGFVERALENLGIDFVLHGHKHKPQFRETIVRDSTTESGLTKRLIVCGAGSVSCTELEAEEQNQYQVIELKSSQRKRDAEFARLEWRSLSRRAGAGWMSSGAWDIPG